MKNYLDMPANIITNIQLEKYFKDWYPHDTDRTNYVHVLRAMNNEYSIKELIKTYNRLLDKIHSLYYRLLTRPNEWYIYNYMPNDKSEIWNELDVYLNMQIERVFDNIDERADEKEIECLVNLRPARNRNLIINRILPKCTEHVIIEYKEIKHLIFQKEDALNHLTPYNKNTNDYNDHLHPYIQTMKRLIKMGYIKDMRDTAFELNAGIKYFPDSKSVIQFISASIIFAFIFIFIVSTLKISLFTIIILIGLPGALISFLKKG